MSHHLKGYARAIQDATGTSYMTALRLAQTHIDAAKLTTGVVLDRSLWRSTVTANLIDIAKAALAEGGP